MTTVHKLSGGVPDCDSYVVQTAEAVAAVDPGVDPRRTTRFLEERDLELTHVLLTHVHYDHSAAAPDLRERYGAEVAAHEAEAEALENGRDLTLHEMFQSPPAPCPVDTRLRDGDSVAGLEARHTPGHSPGATCYAAEDQALVGDLVFPGGSFGRADLPGSDAAALVDSLERAASWDLEAFHSGHGGSGPWSDVEKAAKLAEAML